jgi:hypothetical protein
MTFTICLQHNVKRCVDKQTHRQKKREQERKKNDCISSISITYGVVLLCSTRLTEILAKDDASIVSSLLKTNDILSMTL